MDNLWPSFLHPYTTPAPSKYQKEFLEAKTDAWSSSKCVFRQQVLNPSKNGSPRHRISSLVRSFSTRPTALYPAVDLSPHLRNLQPAPKPICEVVASADGASAHTAHWLSRTRYELRTHDNKLQNTTVAAGACPTESMEVVKTRTHSTHGVPNVPTHECPNLRRLQTGLASKTTNEPQTQVARHPGIPVSIVRSFRAIPSSYFIC